MAGVDNWDTTPADNAVQGNVDWSEGMAPAKVNDSARQMMADLAKSFLDRFGALDTTGSAGVYALATNTGITQLKSGLRFTFKANFSSVGGDTLNVDGKGAKKLRVVDDDGERDIVEDEIDAGGFCDVIYDPDANSGAGAWMLLGEGALSATAKGRELVAKETVAEMRTLLEVPSSETAVTLTGTQTVSNKTLTSPVINAPTGSFISGYLYGLKTSNAVVDAANDITVDAGVCASDDATPAFIALASAITKQADATWVAGDGNGGYDSGTAPADGTLHVFAIMRSDTQEADILFSASATSPIMPANYDHKRRIASIPRISAVNLGFVQVGDLFMLSEVSAAGNYINPGTIASLRTLPAVPTGISVEARLAVVLDAASSSPTSLTLTSPEQSDVVPSVGVYSFRAAPGRRVSGNLGLLTDTSARVRARLSHSDSSSSYGFSGHGWRDTRGRI